MARRFFILRQAPIPLSVLTCGFILLTACGRQSDNFQGNTVAVQSKAAPMAMEAIDATAAGGSDVAFVAPVVVPDQPVQVQKKILKEGTLRYSVNDYNGARKELNKIVAGYGGYLLSESEQRSDVSWESSVEIKVPASKFDPCLEALSGTANTLVTKEVTAKDVTEEYVDVAARMKARKEVEQRYLEILKQAKTVEDILKVEEQLKSIREEVEAAQGRLQYIDHNVAMSTIHLTFFQTFANTSPQGPGFFSRIFFSIKDGWNGLLSFMIELVSIWPSLLVLIIGVTFIRRYLKRRRARKMVSA